MCILSHFPCVQLFVTLWTVAHRPPRSIRFSRQEYRSGLPFSPPGDLPDPGIKTVLSRVHLLLLLSRFSHIRLCDPIDGSLPGSSIPGILQARTLEWVSIFFSNAWKWSRSVVSDSATSWTAAYQAPPCMGFSRQEYWSGVPLPSPLHLLLGWCKSSYGFALLNFAVWFWNTFLSKCGYVIHHFNAHSSLYYLLFILYLF